jgi:hypothetical protein
MDYLNAIGNFLIDSSPEVLLGGVITALVVALTTAGLYRMTRGGSSKENPMVMAGMIVAANVVSMILAAGYVSGKHSSENGLLRTARFSAAVPDRAIMPYRGGRDSFPLISEDASLMERRRIGRSPRTWSQREGRGTESDEAKRTRDGQASDQTIPRA